MTDDAVENNQTYYIRTKGRIAGPFTLSQLRSLRNRGQISRVTEISMDRDAWVTVATIEHLLTPVSAKKNRSAPVEVLEEEEAEPDPVAPPPKTLAPIWYYAIGDEQAGPVTLLELRGLLSSGQLQSEDQVWKEGMADWESVSRVSELNQMVKVSNSSSGGRNFCYACGEQTDVRAEVCPKCGVRQRTVHAETKSRGVAIALALLVGGLGIHKFYLNRPVAGVLYLLFCWAFIPAILAFVDAIVLICMSDQKFHAKYSN